MTRAGKWFFAVVAAQALFLAGWAGYHEAVRQQAPAVLLNVRPVDPRDLLRGDYMVLSYDISTAAPGRVVGDAPQPGEAVWVLLEPRDRYHVIAAVSAERLTPRSGQVLVKGEVSYRREAGSVAIDYGIERFFVPEGKGTPRFSKLEIEAAVSPAHRLYIRRMLLDGKSYP